MDTPGIGGSGKVTQKLIEYLPNALAFIFVIDVSSAGGMQKDRVKVLLSNVHYFFYDQFFHEHATLKKRNYTSLLDLLATQHWIPVKKELHHWYLPTWKEITKVLMSIS